VDYIKKLKRDFPHKAEWIDKAYEEDFGPSGIEPPDDAEWAERMRKILTPAPSFTGKGIPIKRPNSRPRAIITK
jgi:hypothetical protein